MADRKPLARADFEVLPAAFYDCRDEENLSHECVEDAVEAWIDILCEPDCDVAKTIRDGGPLTVTAFRRREVDDHWIAGTVEYMIESLGDRFAEEYGGGEDDDGAAPSPAAQGLLAEAVRAFVEAQKVWQCEPAGAYTYSVEEVEAMMRAHRPDWFDAPLAEGGADAR